MEEKAADKLQGREGDQSVLFRMAIVPCLESDFAVLATDQAMVGEGHSVGVATDISIDVLGASKGFFGIEDPLLVPESFEEAIESRCLFQVFRGSPE